MKNLHFCYKEQHLLDCEPVLVTFPKSAYMQAIISTALLSITLRGACGEELYAPYVQTAMLSLRYTASMRSMHVT